MGSNPISPSTKRSSMKATIIIEDNKDGETVSIRTEFSPPLKDLKETEPTMAARATLDIINYLNTIKGM